jgi:uncharacterized protein YgiM (DUF1202 family)
MKHVVKKTSLWLVFFLASLITVQAFAQKTQVCGIISTNSTSLNIRKNASQTTKVISKAARGSAVRILGTRGAWYKVKLNNGKIGYGSMDYIREVTPRTCPTCGIVATRSTSLNIRRSASRGAKVLAKARKGSTVRILGQHGGWYQVLLNNGKVGYASTAYIRIANYNY